MSCHRHKWTASLFDVTQTEFSENFESTKFDHLTREDLIQKNALLENELFLAFKEIYKLKNQNLTDDQLKLVMAEQLGELQKTLYGASSERYKKPNKPKEQKVPAPRAKLPSERYPNIPVRNELVPFDDIPTCDACGKNLVDSGMTEESEQLNVIPKRFEIINWVRPKFRCSCHGCIKLPPVPRRIIEGSSYSDKMILDVVASKYCDLIPIQRYVAMAARSGLKDLPPQSLIELTHQFAHFVKPVYELIKNEIKSSRVLHADETPHKMLEGSDKSSWYLWGFSTPRFCFLECHDTRSGDVASDILKNSRCEVLMSDVFSGYGKAVRITNLFRQAQGRMSIQNANCNAHARRYFIKAQNAYPEAKFYLDQYHDIYQLEAEVQGKPPDEILKVRSQIKEQFEVMHELAEKQQPSYPSQLKFGKALNYFLENYDGLTLFLEHADVAIDNNLQERLLRNHVIGRKTWYGTHSERGAETAAILFSIIETCKLNQVNPREYLEKLAQDLLQGQNPYTPKDFADLAKN